MSFLQRAGHGIKHFPYLSYLPKGMSNILYIRKNRLKEHIGTAQGHMVHKW